MNLLSDCQSKTIKNKSKEILIDNYGNFINNNENYVFFKFSYFFIYKWMAILKK